jgi:hypothetical protein
MLESVDIAENQARLITRQQALELMTEAQIRTKLSGRWQRVLPGVYATFTGALTFDQRCRAALLYCGTGALLSDSTMLRWLGARYLPPDAQIRVLLPQDRNVHSRDWLTVRRTHYTSPAVLVAGYPCVRPARALAEHALRHPDARASIAVAAWALTSRHVTLAELEAAWERLPKSGRANASRVLKHLQSGVRSVGELDFVALSRKSRLLPPPKLNWLLELPSGRQFSPDALYDAAALIHETNGRGVHGDEEPFEVMQARHDALTTAGFLVLHNSPRQIRTESRRILNELETNYRSRVGLGLPPGVKVLRDSA